MKTCKILLTVFFLGTYGSLMSQMQHGPDPAVQKILSETGIGNYHKCLPENSQIILYTDVLCCIPLPGIAGSAGIPPPLPASVNLTGRSFFMNIHAGSSFLYNKEIQDSQWEVNTTLGYQLEVGYSRRINKLLSYGIGIGMSAYPSEIQTASMHDTLEGHDLAGVLPMDVVERRIHYQDVKEKATITFIDIPIFLEIGNTNYSQLGFFIQLGARCSVPLVNQFDGSGNYDIKGYYPLYGFEIDGIPELGFNADTPLFENEPENKLNPYNISGFISGGISYPLGEKMLIRISASYVHGFTDISAENDEVKNPETANSHMLGNEKSPTLTRSLGGTIGIQYRITVY